MGSRRLDEVLLEFQRIGRHVKVTAVDPESGLEVSIVGDAATSESHLAEIARRKLLRRLSRRDDDPGPGILA